MVSQYKAISRCWLGSGALEKVMLTLVTDDKRSYYRKPYLSKEPNPNYAPFNTHTALKIKAQSDFDILILTQTR